MIRKHKQFTKPRKAFEKSRIKEENVLVKKYGLKNKREIWKTLAKIKYFRTRAKALAKATFDEQQVLLGKLKIIGLNTHTLADVLALNVEDLLKRRLSSVVVGKGLAQTQKHARQMVIHKKILIDNKVVNSPSYIVKVKEESLIFKREKILKPVAEVIKEAV